MIFRKSRHQGQVRGRTAILATVLVFVGLLSTFARATDEPASVTASLVSSSLSFEPGNNALLGVRLQIDKGWHLYWQFPGESGLAPSVAWQVPRGFVAHEIQWPYPTRLEKDGIVNFIYERQVILPITMFVPAQAKFSEEATVTAQVNWLACREVCVPGSAKVSLTLPVISQPGKANSKWRKSIEEAQQNSAQRLSNWLVFGQVKKDILLLTITPPPQVAAAKLRGLTFFPITENVADLHYPARFREAAGKLLIEIPRDAKQPKAPQQFQGILVSTKGLEGKNRVLLVDTRLQE